jgi:signal transduction histidine kinase
VLGERNRLAREIHDTLAQGFAGISSTLQLAEAALSRKPEKALPALFRPATWPKAASPKPAAPSRPSPQRARKREPVRRASANLWTR